MTARAWVAAAVTSAATLRGAPAAAQSTRYPPPAPDLDVEREQRSGLWEGASDPGRRRYDELVARAANLLARNDGAQRDDARAALGEATALLPDRPDAWAWLGVVADLDGDAPACRAALDRAWALDATWVSDNAARRRGLAPLLAVCRARDGDLEGAVEVLERQVTRGDGNVELRWRLGEAYVGLGRLAEARAQLAIALEQPSSAYYAAAAWAAVVAADRDRDPQGTTAAAEVALRIDPRLAYALAPPGGLLRAADAGYYAALAFDVAGRPEHAVLRWRRYLAADDDGWHDRAHERLRAAARFPAASRLELSGTDLPPRTTVAAAVDDLAPELDRCLRDTPRLLLQVSVTRHGPPEAPAPRPRDRRAPAPTPPPPAPARPRGPGASAPPAGVAVDVVDSDEPDAAAVDAAVACVRGVAARAALPPPRTPRTWYRAAVLAIRR